MTPSATPKGKNTNPCWDYYSLFFIAIWLTSKKIIKLSDETSNIGFSANKEILRYVGVRFSSSYCLFLLDVHIYIEQTLSSHNFQTTTLRVGFKPLMEINIENKHWKPIYLRHKERLDVSLIFRFLIQTPKNASI